jgi:hypothetical protein
MFEADGESGDMSSGSAGSRSAGFASVAEALRMAEAAVAYLNSPAAAGLDGSACGEALVVVGRIQSRLSAAQAALLCQFDAADAHDADGYGSSSAWLAGKTHLNRKDAKATVRQMRLLGQHPLLDDATGSGTISRSWGREMAGWTGRIGDQDLRQEADKILLDAAAAGADLDDLRVIAQAAYEAWRARQPDPDDPDKRFGERFVQVDTTLDDAGRMTGDLTPECAAAVQAVLEALGKKRGAEDDRTQAMRFHDALQEGCELLLRAKLVPGRAGVDTRVDVHIGLGDLRRVDGAPVMEEAWLAARAGEHGYLCGKDAETVSCDALIVPVVTGGPDWDVIAKMIALVLNAGWQGTGGAAQDQPAGTGAGSADALPRPLPPAAWEALQYAMARLAIDFVSGPGALASVLRTGLLPAPYNGKSVPIDVGWSDSIPESIRRAVILRDKKCAWAGGCGKRPASCDVHHIKHKKDGGPTSVKDCVLLCQYHHDICIHRWGWEIELLPDGSTRAFGPQGQVLRSHGPPAAQAA